MIFCLKTSKIWQAFLPYPVKYTINAPKNYFFSFCWTELQYSLQLVAFISQRIIERTTFGRRNVFQMELPCSYHDLYYIQRSSSPSLICLPILFLLFNSRLETFSLSLMRIKHSFRYYYKNWNINCSTHSHIYYIHTHILQCDKIVQAI